MPRYGTDALLRADGQTYGSPRSHRTTVGRGLIRAENGRRTSWWHGSGAVQAFDACGVARQWDAGRKCWMCPVADAPQVIRYLERVQRRLVEVTEVRR